MSEPNGQGTDSRAALRQLAEEGASAVEPATSADSWFAPAPKPHGYQPLDPDAMDAAGWPKVAGNGHESRAAEVAVPETGASLQTAAEPGALSRADEWFLRTGRAGLSPESMSEVWDDEDTHVFARPDTAGAPPWAGDQRAQPDQEVEEPPPWESGPWPGPGEERPARQPRSAGGQPRIRRTPSDDTGNWQAMAALAAGVVPLVVPGAVLGVLGLRRARSTGTGRMPAWIGIALSAIWAVVLIVVLASGGSSGPGCSGSSQAAVSGAVSAVMRDLSSGAPPSTVQADLSQAMSQANVAAAGAQQVSVRSAYVTLMTGLQRALATVQTSHSARTYAALSSQLSADNAAITSACKG
jgi:hypothetical protein